MKNTLLLYFFGVIGIVLYLSFLLYSPFSFNYETESRQQYSYIILLPACTLSLLFYFFKCRNVSRYSTLALSGLLLLLLALSFSRFFSFANEHFFMAAVIYIALCMVLLSWKSVKPCKQFISLLFLIFLYELWIGLEQYWNTSYSANSALAIVGTVQNSGVYACWLAAQLPFLFYLFFGMKSSEIMGSFRFCACSLWLRKREVYWRYFRISLFVLLCGVVFFIVAQTRNRSALLMLAAFILFYAIYYGKRRLLNCIGKIPRYGMAAIALIGLFCGGYAAYFLFNLKRASAFGRLLKVQITWQHLTDNIWLGAGLGRFTWYYPQWQQEFFKANPSPPKEYYFNAGESYIIFNEWLQLFMELGVVGFFIFVAALVYFFKTKSKEEAQFLLAAKTTVAVILVGGFTSYPLHVNALLFLLAFCVVIAVIIRSNEPQFTKSVSVKYLPSIRVYLLTILLLSAYTSYIGVQKLLAVTKWNAIRAHSHEEIGAAFNSLYPILKCDGKFLTEYADYLLRDSATCHKAIDVLETAKRYFISRRTMEATGYAYLQAGNYAKAIEHYEWVSHYIPHLFKPKFELLKLYIRNKETSNARRIANTILSMPIKIPSSEVSNIKLETRRILNNL